MTETRLQDYVNRVVEAAPPLTAAQRDHLALLLGPSTRFEVSEPRIVRVAR